MNSITWMMHTTTPIPKRIKGCRCTIGDGYIRGHRCHCRMRQSHSRMFGSCYFPLLINDIGRTVRLIIIGLLEVLTTISTQ